MNTITIQIEEKLLNFINEAELTFTCKDYTLTIHFPGNLSLLIKAEYKKYLFTWDNFIESLQYEYDLTELQDLLGRYQFYWNNLTPFLKYEVIKPVETICYEYV